MTSTLLINEPPLQVLPSLAMRIGLNESMFLQQVHYWLNPKFNKNYFDGCHWVHNTYEQWQEQFPFWGEKTIRRVISNLEEASLLISFTTRDFKKTKYYTVNYDRLSQLQQVPEVAETLGFSPSGQNDQIDVPKRADRSAQSDQIDPVKMTRSYNKDTETTKPENTLPPFGDFAKEEEEEFKAMLGMWNAVIQEKIHPGKVVYPTPKRFAAFNTFLANVRIDWEEYCRKIAQCQFLMGHNGSGFTVTLDWALIPENAYKILEGAIYDKTPPEALPEQDSIQEEVLKELENHGQSPWGKISHYLISKIGCSAYKSWFLKISLLDVGEEDVLLKVETPFIRDYIISHYLRDLEHAVQSVFPTIKHIHFGIHPKEEIISCWNYNS